MSAVDDNVVERYKQQAAEWAAELVTSGMVVGLGTGSTAMYASRRIGRMVHDGRLRHPGGADVGRYSGRGRAAGHSRAGKRPHPRHRPDHRRCR